MELKPGYKQTEVGVIPEEWRMETALNLSQQIMDYRGRTPKKLGYEWGGGDIPALSAGNVKPGYIDFNAECYFGSEELYRRWMTRGIIRKDDILFTTEAPLGNVALVPDDRKYILSQRTILLQIDPGIASSRYIFQLMLSDGFQRVLLDYSSGSTAKGIQRKKFEQLLIAVPPTLAEQEAIAEALSDADALIDALEQLIAKKRHLKQGAMQDLLTGKKRLPGFEGEWEVTTLGALADLYQPVTISAHHFTSSGFPVYGANGIVGYYDKSNHDAWQVTVTCRGSTCGTVNRTVDRCWITGNAMVLNCDGNDALDKEFFYYLLSNQDLSDCITGTGQPQIVRTPIAAFSVSIPRDTIEQTAIAAILSDMDAEIAALEAKLSKARQVKQGMMQELLTGKTRLV